MPPVARRQHEVSRLEGFSDAVFGFALTLLVVSLEIPPSVSRLLEVAADFGPFALTFAMVGWIWWEHNVFFRRYGLQDPWTAFLNLVLLFVVLFYVYPLKFLAIQIVGLVTGGDSTWGETIGEARGLMLVYSAGVVMIFGCFVLLYRHAWTRRDRLGLDARDLIELTFGARSHAISMGLGVLSMLIVAANANWAAVAGMIYVLMGPLHAWNGYQQGAALARFDAAGAADTPDAGAPSPPPRAVP